jgi:transcriptional regulator with XRE-family HTH domain
VQNLGERLKALRNERGLTLVQLGQAVDLSASYLSQIERGIAMPSLPRLAALARKEIHPYRVVLQPGASRGRPPTYPGEEFGFVLKGQLTVTVGKETFVLHAGDSIHYQTLQPHSWRNEGNKECVVIWAASPPIPEAELPQ